VGALVKLSPAEDFKIGKDKRTIWENLAMRRLFPKPPENIK